jgi:uncharacterized membrane protein
MVIDWALRLVHIFSAIFLAGGVFFLWWVLVPALGSVSHEQREAVEGRVRGRWSLVVMITSALLLVGGLINAVLAIRRYEFPDSPSYHLLVAVKIVLALAVFWITAVLAGRSATAERFRQKLPFWMNVNALLVAILICVASWMKVMEHQPRAERASVANNEEPVE